MFAVQWSNGFQCALTSLLTYGSILSSAADATIRSPDALDMVDDREREDKTTVELWFFRQYRTIDSLDRIWAFNMCSRWGLTILGKTSVSKGKGENMPVDLQIPLVWGRWYQIADLQVAISLAAEQRNVGRTLNPLITCIRECVGGITSLSVTLTFQVFHGALRFPDLESLASNNHLSMIPFLGWLLHMLITILYVSPILVGGGPWTHLNSCNKSIPGK
jgi:hypothetical protein